MKRLLLSVPGAEIVCGVGKLSHVEALESASLESVELYPLWIAPPPGSTSPPEVQRCSDALLRMVTTSLAQI